MPGWRQEVQEDEPGVPHLLVAEPGLDTEIAFQRRHSTTAIYSRGDHSDLENCTSTKVTPASNPQMALRIKFTLLSMAAKALDDKVLPPSGCQLSLLSDP